MTIQRDLDFCITTAREAGQYLLEGYESGFQIEYKKTDIDLVTEYDRNTEKLIIERIRSAYPDHKIVGEEGGDMGNLASPYQWYVDPIDGTTNFAHGVPYFSVSIALYLNETPIAGVVYDPSRDECFAGARGYGAHLIRKGDMVRPLRVSQADTLRRSLIATGFPYDRYTSDWDNLAEVSRVVKQVQGLRRAGSAALDLAYVAAGRFDGFWEYKINMYDVAAGVLLVQEAGGLVSNLPDGASFEPRAPLHLVASNHLIHKPLKEMLISEPA